MLLLVGKIPTKILNGTPALTSINPLYAGTLRFWDNFALDFTVRRSIWQESAGTKDWEYGCKRHCFVTRMEWSGLRSRGLVFGDGSVMPPKGILQRLIIGVEDPCFGRMCCSYTWIRRTFLSIKEAFKIKGTDRFVQTRKSVFTTLSPV